MNHKDKKNEQYIKDFKAIEDLRKEMTENYFNFIFDKKTKDKEPSKDNIFNIIDMLGGK